MLNEKKKSKKTVAISILILVVTCMAGISVSAAVNKETRIVEAATYTPIEENSNPLDYVELERTETQRNTLGTPDEIGVPQYTPSDSSEPPLATDETEIPNPLDFQEGTLPVFSSFLWPTTGGWISVGLGGYPGHTGMDIIVPLDTPVYASAPGIVVLAKPENQAGYGKHIAIDHGDGYQTVYAHCNSLEDLAVGDTIEAGQKIASVGESGDSTGVHLHFEIRRNGRLLNPEDYVNADNAPMEVTQS